MVVRCCVESLNTICDDVCVPDHIVNNLVLTWNWSQHIGLRA